MRWFIVLLLCLCALVAHAGSISFKLALTGTQLVLSNSGDSPAFFPAVYALRADGQWQQALPPGGQAAATQLAPAGRIELQWPDARPVQQASPLEQLRPTLVRFMDQAGVGFGQLSFFGALTPATTTVPTEYQAGQLRLSPPGDEKLRATWVLWPQEEGIAGIRATAPTALAPPPARRIDWSSAKAPVSIATGAALPAAVLLHETAQGYQVQHVASGWQPGQQQRSSWLDASGLLYTLALIAAALACATLGWIWRRGRA